MTSTHSQYPNFKPVEVEDKALFSAYTKRYPSYSDFNLLSILFWNDDNSSSYSILNDSLLIKIRDYLGNDYLYSILGTNLIEESIITMLRDVGKLTFVPKTVIENIARNELFLIEPDRDNYDYMISTEKVAKIEGREFKHLRKCVHSFIKQYPDYEVRSLIFNDNSTLQEVTELAQKWYEEKGFDGSKQNEEIRKLKRFIDYSTTFDCKILGLYVQNKLVACIFNELLDGGVVMSHSGLSDREIETAASMMEHLNCNYFYNNGYPLQNIQQDTGLPGLRAAKLTYNPVYFLEKYLIRLKG